MSRLVFAFVLALVPLAASGHGPTVHLDADAVEPARLEITRGEAVHFVNRSAATQRVLGADDAVRILVSSRFRRKQCPCKAGSDHQRLDGC